MGTNKRTFPFKGDITNSKKVKMITPILLVGLAALLSPVSAMPNTEEYKAKGPLPYGINYQHHLEEAQPEKYSESSSGSSVESLSSEAHLHKCVGQGEDEICYYA